MIPIKDILPSRTTPFVIFFLIAMNSAVWVVELLQGTNLNEFVVTWGFIPLRMLLDDDPQKWVTPFSSMFMHGGWMHIVGNMWFLWIFGDNVEDAFGHGSFIVFFLVCGLGASLLQFLFSINSQVPMIGASGAISGVLGAYACFYPRARVVTLIPIFFFIHFAEIPAILFIGLWFVFQLMGGCGAVASGVGSGVAFWAHVGGFFVGYLIARLWKNRLIRQGKPIQTPSGNIFTFRKRQGL